jgi:phosphatidylserine/phosphatidylglycerophosphate/cardiolipin synthase-like enzyme
LKGKIKILLIFIILLLIVGVGGFFYEQRAVTETETKTASEVILEITETAATLTLEEKPSLKCKVFFTPNPLVLNQLVKLIDSSEKYVYAAFYDLDLSQVANAFLEAKNRGINVRVVVDSDNMENPAIAKLLKAGVVRGDEDPDYMHNKFMVIDDEVVWVGSLNPTYNGIYRNNNSVVIISGSPELIEDFKQEFEELWNGIHGGGMPVSHPEIELTENFTVEVYFAPEDNVENQILEEIGKAERSIFFATFTFTSRKIASLLLERFSEGVEVKGIYESFQVNKYSTYGILKESGVKVIKDGNPPVMHHKFFIIDHETVITGSLNPTKHANKENDESIIIIHNSRIAEIFYGEFEKLWEKWSITVTETLRFQLIVDSRLFLSLLEWRLHIF